MVMWSLLALVVLAVTVVVAMNWAPDQPVQKLQDRWRLHRRALSA
jgi:hypothetical protein